MIAWLIALAFILQSFASIAFALFCVHLYREVSDAHERISSLSRSLTAHSKAVDVDLGSHSDRLRCAERDILAVHSRVDSINEKLDV